GHKADGDNHRSPSLFPPWSGDSGWSTSDRWRWQATIPGYHPHPASPSVPETVWRKKTATPCIAAVPLRKSCQRREKTCRSSSVPSAPQIHFSVYLHQYSSGYALWLPESEYILFFRSCISPHIVTIYFPIAHKKCTALPVVHFP